MPFPPLAATAEGTHRKAVPAHPPCAPAVLGERRSGPQTHRSRSCCDRTVSQQHPQQPDAPCPRPRLVLGQHTVGPFDSGLGRTNHGLTPGLASSSRGHRVPQVCWGSQGSGREVRSQTARLGHHSTAHGLLSSQRQDPLGQDRSPGGSPPWRTLTICLSQVSGTRSWQRLWTSSLQLIHL